MKAKTQLNTQKTQNNYVFHEILDLKGKKELSPKEMEITEDLVEIHEIKDKNLKKEEHLNNANEKEEFKIYLEGKRIPKNNYKKNSQKTQVLCDECKNEENQNNKNNQLIMKYYSMNASKHILSQMKKYYVMNASKKKIKQIMKYYAMSANKKKIKLITKQYAMNISKKKIKLAMKSFAMNAN